MLSRLRSFFLWDPLIWLYTIVFGALSLLSSFFDKSGRIQHGFARLWAKIILGTIGASPQIEGLGKIEYTSSAAVALAYDQADLPPGHGFLVPRSEGRKIMACTFVHKKFPHRAPEGMKLLR